MDPTKVVEAANPYATTTAGAPGDKQPVAAPTAKTWAGKFKSEQELETGYQNQQTVLTERTNQLQQSQDRIAQLETMLTSVADRMSPVERTTQRSRAQQLLEAQGIPVEALYELIDERGASTVPKEVEKFMAPFTQGARAQQTLADEFPDINVNDVQQFLRANPGVKARYDEKVKTSPSEAMYFAYAQYSRSAPEATDLSGQTRARLDAALPGNRGGNPVPVDAANDVAAGWENFNRSGNVMDFLRPRLAHIVGKPTTE
jgi:TolA-binding protein